MIISYRLSVMTLFMIFIQSVFVDAFSQTENKYCIVYKSGQYCPEEGNNLSQKIKNLRSEHQEYILIQFFELPNETTQAQLKSAGTTLLKYVPNYAYWASFQRALTDDEIKKFKIRSIEKILPEHKIDEKLNGEVKKEKRTFTDLEVTYFQDADTIRLKHSLANLGAVIIKSSPFQNSLIIRISSGRIQALGSVPQISYIMPAPPKPEHSNFISVNQHRNNVLQSDFAGQRGLSGNGLTVGIDDEGAIGIHQDLKPVRITNLSPPAINNHATHVAGTTGGSGNIDPRARGAAFNANLVAQSFPGLINNGPSYYNTYGMTVTNNSYGYLSYWGVYDNSSNYTDKTQDNVVSPGLLHVVATHNGGAAGFYTVSSGWATAKNVLSVGSVNEHDVISGFSGKGPVNDGRLKPEIVGLGESVYSTLPGNSYTYFSGTSMACPGVTGSVTLLYERYNQLKGVRPNADIIKALVCNTADDLGNAGPDYSYGFGRINSKRAVEALEANLYFENTISQGQNLTHTINVPSGTGQLRVLLYWKDKEGAEFSSVNLVNNLDIQITKSPNTYLPWVLSSANPESIAVRGVDNINNIEQVTVDNPDAGSYTVNIKGTAIPFGPQRYVVAYEFVRPFIALTFPYGNESLIPNEYTQIRWDAFGTGNYTAEYSTNNGSSWINIASDIPSNQHYADWFVPSGPAAMLVRVRSGSFSSQSIRNFSVLSVPSNLVASNPSTGSIKFEWNPVPGASSYDVYLLEPQDKVIEFEATTTATSYVFQNRPLGTENEVWMSVRAKTASGIISERAYAINKSAVEVQGLCNASGTITREVWTSIPGSVVSNIPVNTSPNQSSSLTLFEAPTNFGINYGQRIRGTICAPLSGNYIFWISSNDNSELWLSTDDTPSNKVRIASVTGYTGVREWTKYPSQRSASIALVGGKTYYIEALHKQGASNDNLAVGWQLPDATLERPIPGSRLSPFGKPQEQTTQHGLLGTYFRDLNFDQNGYSRIDSVVNFNFGTNSPAPNIGVDKFSIRWTGQVEAVYSEQYRFYTTSNDGVRLSVNGVQIINNFTDHPATENSGVINLLAGEKYDVVLEYFENVGSAVISLSWSSPSQPKQIIPSARLTPAETDSKIASFDLPLDAKNIVVYPNPAEYKLNIWAPGSEAGEVQLEILDMNGAQLLSEEFIVNDTDYPIELDISNIPSGFYMFVIKTNSFKEVRKFTVAR
ncbi:S8 family serine peptidase [Sporocytophaga myxococcoides]|uniref:S8 family serine peptidase n=1 Tax=Sporocytophaga myxococcoides TaxID=153721 RepID=UPI0009DB7B99|nr:PA14 domain-containing protein [Sporocytophaga myxococcoides]